LCAVCAQAHAIPRCLPARVRAVRVSHAPGEAALGRPASRPGLTGRAHRAGPPLPQRVWVGVCACVCVCAQVGVRGEGGGQEGEKSGSGRKRGRERGRGGREGGREGGRDAQSVEGLVQRVGGVQAVRHRRPESRQRVPHLPPPGARAQSCLTTTTPLSHLTTTTPLSHLTSTSPLSHLTSTSPLSHLTTTSPLSYLTCAPSCIV
jgi:hypothetical protein